MDITSTLNQIILNPNLHGLWLNTLSYLEYRGFRKIARSQKSASIDAEILFHAAEEVRHALFFKKLALKLGTNKFRTYQDSELLGDFSAKKYFYDIDTGVANLLTKDSTFESYILISWLIEVRAMSVYTIYNELLLAAGQTISLDSILREEGRHLEKLKELSSAIFQKTKLPIKAFESIEKNAFQIFWKEISRHTHEAIGEKLNLGTEINL
ncbi:MAG: hypothetical protein KDD34_09995 [Bdellovibrionales bacterium]|nr:hypothetical protein [Bdellovibrionales bacterium]